MTTEIIHSIELVAIIAQQSRTEPPPKGEHYRPISESPCLIFKGKAKRYGSIMFNGKRYLAHRVMFEASVNEPLPPELVVRHRCDRPGCVNPSHLESGTSRDNCLDRTKRQRNPATGARNGMNLYPERVPRGIRMYGRTITEADAADIKQALQALVDPRRGDFIAVAAHFATTPDQVEAIHRRHDFVAVEPSGKAVNVNPLSRETLTVPFPALRRNTLTESLVADIRWEYFIVQNADRRELKLDLRNRFGISRATLQNVLARNTFQDVAPEIPVLNEKGSGVAVLSDSEVQCIRATWERFPELHQKGLTAALARLFPVTHQSIQRVIDRDQRKDVPDDPAKALTLEELPFKALHRRGEQHPQSRLKAEQVREIRRLAAEGRLTNRAIAARFNVTAPLIGMIVNHKIWKEVDERYP